MQGYIAERARIPRRRCPFTRNVPCRPCLFSASCVTLCVLLSIPRMVLSFVVPSFGSELSRSKGGKHVFSILAEARSDISILQVDSSPDIRRITAPSTSLDTQTSTSSESPVLGPEITTQQQLQRQSMAITNKEGNDLIKPKKKKYQRKREQPPTEKELDLLKQVRQAEYESAVSNHGGNYTKTDHNNNNVLFWDFERLFPEPVWDDATIIRDLYEVSDRDKKQRKIKPMADKEKTNGTLPLPVKEAPKMQTLGGSSNKFMRSLSNNLRSFRPPTTLSDVPSLSKNLRSFRAPTTQSDVPYNPPPEMSRNKVLSSTLSSPDLLSVSAPLSSAVKPSELSSEGEKTNKTTRRIVPGINIEAMIASTMESAAAKVDRTLTRMVEERLYGYRRTINGDYVYETSLMGDGAVKFRDGKRLGYPLQVNIDLLNFNAKREMRHGRLEEAEELYEKAISVDPKDGRAYLGLSKIAERRRDFAYAKECLRVGISRSVSFIEGSSAMQSSGNNGGKGISGAPGSTNASINIPDHGANPFLLQALGSLEEQLGHLTEAEALYVEATKSRPTHAAAWVALGQLRYQKLRQGPNAGRICFQTAERELQLAGLPKSAYVYTAWASLEYKAGDIRRAREFFQSALEIDPKCSTAWLQLGVLEANKENWPKAKECFETVLKFDQRNSRVLQAYAIMESKRPDGDSREVIELFECALTMNPRDGGVYQAYALYVAKLGDIDGARTILKRGTEVDKRHAPLWQAWGVLESRNGSAAVARDIFQQGIWACAQSSGGQSGGRHCARLWQAWGVLEAKEEDPAAARRCFNRALDADSRNVAAVMAWTLMEQELGNYKDARLIFERALKQFSSPSDDKMSLWRAYEVMESKAGNVNTAQQVYQRSIKDAILRDDSMINEKTLDLTSKNSTVLNNKKTSEVEVVTWKSRMDSGFGGNEVWMADDGSFLGKVPSSTMKKKRLK